MRTEVTGKTTVRFDQKWVRTKGTRYWRSAAVSKTSRSRLDPCSTLRGLDVLRLGFDTAALLPRDCVPHPLLTTPDALCAAEFAAASPLLKAPFKLPLL